MSGAPQISGNKGAEKNQQLLARKLRGSLCGSSRVTLPKQHQGTCRDRWLSASPPVCESLASCSRITQHHFFCCLFRNRSDVFGAFSALDFPLNCSGIAALSGDKYLQCDPIKKFTGKSACESIGQSRVPDTSAEITLWLAPSSEPWLSGSRSPNNT